MDTNSLSKTIDGLKAALEGIKSFEKEVNINLPALEEADKEKADEVKKMLSKLDIKSADSVMLELNTLLAQINAKD